MLIELSFKGLERKESGLSNVWRLWELKNPNMHRGIIVYEPPHEQGMQHIESLIRQLVVDEYKPSWNKGFGFGVVMQFNSTPIFEINDFINCVDSYNKNKGVLQWIVAIDHVNKKIFAVHMWSQGALHSSYIDAIEQVITHQYSIEKVYKKTPKFFIVAKSYVKSSVKVVASLSNLQVIIGVVFCLFLIFKLVSKS